MRLFTPWQGAWLADVDIDLDATGVVPTGPVTLVIGATTLIGTIDPTASGKFATHVRARIVAGGNGWQQVVAPQALHNDGGVISVNPITATAALVGETAIVATPSVVGTDFVRFSGPDYPAYQVLRGLDWYVDFNGLTQVSTRIPIPVVDPDVHILSFDPLYQTATIATETLLVPGMVLTDSRFDSATIRQVEQIFNANGSRATCWLSKSAMSTSSLGGSVGKLAQIAVGLPTLRAYRYRVVAQNPDGRLVLQAVSKAAGIPDQLPIKVWYGAPGVSGKPTPGTIVILRFLEGDPGQPVVVGFDDTTPIEIDLAASAIIDIAAPAVGIGVKGARTGVATLQSMAPLFILWTATASGVAAAMTALASALPDINSGLQTPQPPTPPGSIALAKDAATAAAAAATALATGIALPTNFSATVQGSS